MEDEGEQRGDRTAFFPAPPPFWKNFTEANVARLEQLKQAATTTDTNPSDGAPPPQLSASQLLDLPAELGFLVPPEPPADDEDYRALGAITHASDVDAFGTKIESIANALTSALPGEAPILPGEWKYKPLYSTPPPEEDVAAQARWSRERQQHLLRYVRSLLLNFLELLGVLVADPTSDDANGKIKDILNLVANIHALINEYRPHQARETLILTMQDQLDRKRAEVEGIRKMKEKVAATLAEFGKSAPESGTADARSRTIAAASAEEKRRDRQRYMWRAMDELLSH
jgi:mediator of RNA polymerase II transcription subunit 7